MDPASTTWIVAFDSQRARFFAEPARSGPLRELGDLHMQATDEERAAARRQRATVHSRFGAGRSAAGERDPAHLAEARFVKRIATLLMLAAGRGEFERLALMAPPHALGALRKVLAPAIAQRVDVTDPHARTDEDAESMRRFLREARARTWRSETAAG